MVIRKGIAVHSWRRRELTETFRWLFVDNVQSLYKQKKSCEAISSGNVA
jgi:hypothetical protein